MPKQRAPISTRLRNRDKNGVRITPTREASQVNPVKKEEHITSMNHLAEDNITFSPRADPDIYMDELQSPLSFVRGTDEERNQFLKDEDDVMSQSFGSDYKSSLNTSTFYYAKVSAPIPSKRTRHLHIPSPNMRIQTQSSSVNRRTSPPSPSPSPTFSSPSSTPTPSPSTSTSKARKTISATKNRNRATSAAPITPKPTKAKSTLKSATAPKSTLTPTQLMLAAAAESKAKSGGKKVSSTSKKSSTKKESAKMAPTPQYIAVDDSNLDNMEIAPATPLPLSKKLPVYIKMDPKDKEREYWRRQRRVFVHSRFLTNEEGVMVAKTVYSNLSISPTNRMVTSMQGNIANFRTKLRRVFASQAKKFNMSKEYLLTTNEAKVMGDITTKMNQNALKSIWEHWIADPFVDTKLFYANKASVDLLRDITVKAMIISFKEQYEILSPRQARTEMRKLDLISRTLELPDTSELC